MAERKVTLSDVSFLIPIPVNSHATYEKVLTMPIVKIPKSSIGISDFLFLMLLSIIFNLLPYLSSDHNYVAKLYWYLKFWNP